MRILQIVHMFPPEQSAGTELYTQALSRALLTRGHDCFVLAGSNQIASGPAFSIGVQGSPTVARLVGLRRRSGLPADIYDSTVDHLLRKFLDLWQPSVVHLQHWLRLSGNLVAICAELGIPSVVTLHDQWIACPRIHRVQPDGTFCSMRETPCVSCVDRDPWQADQEVARELRLRHQLINQELQLADCILVPSVAQQHFLQQITDFPLERLRVVPLGSPVEELPRTPEHREKPSDAPVKIGYWGYLAPLKGVHVLLEAARLLAGEADARVEWHLLGVPIDPTYYERLKELAEGLPVTFHGPYRQRDLSALSLDLAVFPSLGYETYSFVLDEAFRMGIPAIVSDRGAPADRIGQAGIPFAAGDAEDLARKIQRLLHEPDILEGLQRALPKEGAVSMEDHAAEMEKIYQEIAELESGGKKEVFQPYRSLLELREQQLMNREQALSDRDRQVEELSRQMTHLTEDLKNQQAKLQEQNEENLLLRNKLAESDRLLADLQARLAEQDRLLLALRAELEAHSQEATALHEQVVERDRLLLALRAELETRVQEAGAMRTDLDARTQEITALRQQVLERDRLLEMARQSLLGSLDRALKSLLERLNSMLHRVPSAPRDGTRKEIP